MVALAMTLGAISTLPAISFQVAGSAALQVLGLNSSVIDHFNTVVSAPFSEELVKGIALVALVLFRKGKFNSLVDFLVYACAVGIGFELIENILYQWSSLEQKDQLAGWIDEFNQRTLASAGSHAFFSVWMGLGAWSVFKARHHMAWLLAPCTVVLSMVLHSLNNLSAVLQELGPPDQTVPINRVGVSLAVISDHLDLALFIGLIGFAILRDLRFLIDFCSWVQARLMREGAQMSSAHLLILRAFMNPVNHLLASSTWSWNLVSPHRCVVTDRSRYRQFARLALDAARRDLGDLDVIDNLTRSGCVDQAVLMVQSLSHP